MDLNTVTTYRSARTREDLRLVPGEQFVAGGTEFFSEPRADAKGVVDLTTLDWPTVEDLPGGGLRVSALCTVAELAALPRRDGWSAHPLFAQCATALLASFKIWNVATVGGNICRSFAAGSMISLSAALDAAAVIWRPDGTELRAPVADLITGNGTNTLARGEVLRAVDFPAHALRATTAFRRIALAELGRSGAVVTGRRDEDGSTVFCITASTLRPVLLRYPDLPDSDELSTEVLAAEGYYSDPLGAADWRRGVTAVLAEEILDELRTGAADLGDGAAR